MHGLPGYFITLEGGEGAGKTTLISLLAERWVAHGYQVVTTREPGGSVLGEKIRDLLLGTSPLMKVGPQAELLLFLAARAQHLEECIRPALEEGKIVLCDRFNDSTIAYQGAARKLHVTHVKSLCHLLFGEMQPNLTLFLDLDPAIGLARAQKRFSKQGETASLDRIEKEGAGFHRLIREGFLALAQEEPDRICLIDAEAPIETVLQTSLHSIEQRLGLKIKT